MKRLSDTELRILESGTVSCRDVTAVLGGYVEGDLIPSVHMRIQDHIESCIECQEGEKGYRDVITLAKELPEPPLSDDVKRRLREALNAKLGLSLPIE